MDAPVLYEDDDLLIVDKPAGVLVVPAPGRSTPTVLEILGRGRRERLYPVHRLDLETSGTLVLARSMAAKKALEKVFREHLPERIYLGLVSRVPAPVAGRIESRLAEREGVMVVVTRGGLRAVTHYRTLVRKGPFALVEFRLETGRRNQIRVHMAELGCPIVGDRKYGWRAKRTGKGNAPGRALLHAWRLRLDHPLTGARIEVEAVPPEPELRP